jgi:aspartyl-tRNA(Asn)/glutamyl-tRNA(Gln) amidotransferase subunit A
MFDSLQAMRHALHTRQISSVELTTHYLKKMSASTLNAYISTDDTLALQQAKAADRLFKNNTAHALTGIPFAHKDVFCTTELPTTCASKMLHGYQSPFDATIVSQLKNEHAVMLGKTNMDEFAMGSSNENSYYGPVRNPWDERCIPGGSSGGSAAAVAGGLAAFTTGSDTGGSIRQPASFCGISGIKPTYGLVSRYGMVAYASSLDQAGPFARSAEDLALVLQVLAGHCPKDSTSINRPVPNYCEHLHKPIKKLRIGVHNSFYQTDVSPAIRCALQQALQYFEQMGAHIVPLTFALEPLWTPCYYVIACAEASSNLSRYDGLNFGYRSEKAATVRELIMSTRTEGFGSEVKRRILTGTHVLSSGFFDAYYLQALKIRRLIQEEFQTTFQTVDVILGPTTPTAALQLGAKYADPVQAYLADVFTVHANLAGLPALSIPMGFDGHLPIGMQFIGNHFSEAQLLALGHQYQQVTDWHKQSPKESV